MRKRKKITKLWIVLTLVVSLLAVQTMQIMAEASTGTADLSNPTVVVNDIAELQNAVANANDGDVIGINTLISITTDIGQLGSVESGKYLYLVRMNENARFEITQQGNVSFCNMTIDGQKSSITGTMAMFTVMGSLSLNNVTVQNCSTQGSGAVAWIEPSGAMNATNAIFSDWRNRRRK